MNAADAVIYSDDLTRSRQGWTREVTVRLLGHKVRAHVYRDSYPFQSRIYVEVWSPTTLSWNRIQTLSGENHDGLPSAYALLDNSAQRAEVTAASGAVVDELVAYAREILG